MMSSGYFGAAPSPEQVRSWPGVHDVEIHGADLRCTVEAEHLGHLVSALGHHDVTSLTCQPPTLEEMFLRHYGDELAAMAVGVGDEGAIA